MSSLGAHYVAQHLVALRLELDALRIEILLGPNLDLVSELNLVRDKLNLLQDAVDDPDEADAFLDIFVVLVCLLGVLDSVASGFGFANGGKITCFVAQLLILE